MKVYELKERLEELVKKGYGNEEIHSAGDYELDDHSTIEDINISWDNDICVWFTP